jgi:hypothetical protein
LTLYPLASAPSDAGFPGGKGNSYGLFAGINSTPFVRGGSALGVPVRESEKVRLPEFSVSGSATFCDLNETESLAFVDRWSDRMAIETVVDKVSVCNWKLPIVGPAVIGELNFYPCEHAVGRLAKNAIRVGAEHFYCARSELSVYLVSVPPAGNTHPRPLGVNRPSTTQL